MKKEELRKATIVCQGVKKEVLFHEWGLELVLNEQGSDINRTVAIIEHTDGIIEMIVPKNGVLKFEDLI